MQKKVSMDVENKNWKNVNSRLHQSKTMENENPLDRGLFIPLVKNETNQERANRILAIMSESNDRINQVLEIFNRMKR
ncbi:MAG: hypothetical protein VW312_04585 [Opitutales bacterium]